MSLWSRAKSTWRLLGPGFVTGSSDDDPSGIATYSAPTFYAVIALATVVGVTVNFVGIKPFQMLYYSAVINGIIAPFLMAMIMLVGNNKRVMGEHVNSRSVGLLGWAITIIMGCCAAALVAALISGQVT